MWVPDLGLTRWTTQCAARASRGWLGALRHCPYPQARRGAADLLSPSTPPHSAALRKREQDRRVCNDLTDNSERSPHPLQPQTEKGAKKRREAELRKRILLTSKGENREKDKKIEERERFSRKWRAPCSHANNHSVFLGGVIGVVFRGGFFSPLVFKNTSTEPPKQTRSEAWVPLGPPLLVSWPSRSHFPMNFFCS